MNDKPRAQRVPRRGSKGVSLVGDAYEYTARPHELQASRIVRQFGCGRELAISIAELAYPHLDHWGMRA